DPGAFATFTISFRPSNDWSLSLLIAACASASVDISTNPNPRESPVMRSVITVADSTVPHWLKYSRRLSEAVESGRRPTYRLDATRRVLVAPYEVGALMNSSASRTRSVEADDPTEARPVSQRGKVWRTDPARLTVSRVSGNPQRSL